MFWKQTEKTCLVMFRKRVLKDSEEIHFVCVSRTSLKAEKTCLVYVSKRGTENSEETPSVYLKIPLICLGSVT
jgi:hypothetical protein